MLQRLIVELDDAHGFYRRLGDMLIDRHLSGLLLGVLQSHDAITRDLTRYMRTLGGPTSRGSSLMGRFHARYLAWRTTTRVDVELGCMAEIKRREAKLAQHFAVAAEHAPWLDRRLYQHRRELEDAHARIEWAMRVSAVSTWAPVSNPVVAAIHFGPDYP